jgi:methylmalonyl-CoA/ethylmalonyl-CoA epimerase
MIHRLNHVAIAVHDLEKAVQLYRDTLGATVSQSYDLPDHGVTTVFVELANTKIELITPYGNDSPISGFLEKHPDGGIHHLCFEVEDLHEAQEMVQQQGVRDLGQIKIGAHGKPVLFLHPKDCLGCLLELEEV